MVELRQKLSDIINYQESVKTKNESLSIELAKGRVQREHITSMYTPKLRDLNAG